MSTEPEGIGAALAAQVDRLAASRPRLALAVTDPQAGVKALTKALSPEATELRRLARLEAWSTIVPPRYGDPTFASLRGQLPDDVVSDLEAWATDPVRNLLVLGPVGTGKTHAAWAALRRAYGLGHSVIGVGVVDLLDGLRPSADDGVAVVGALRDVDLLFADDLGAERATDWTGERLYALIHHRWEHQRPLVITANLEPAALAAAVGPRIYSRLVDDALVLRLSGGDRRRGGAA